MKNNLQKLLLRGITDIFRPLLEVAPDDTLTRDFFHVLGWDVEALLNGDLTPLTAVLATVEQRIGQVEQALGTANTVGVENFSALRTALQATKDLGQAFQQVASLSLAGNLASTFYSDVLQKLVTSYLLTQQGKLYYLLIAAGIIVPDTITIQQNGRYVKYISQVPLFSFARLLNFLKSPKQVVAAEYWPNGAADFATTHSTSVVAQKLLPRLTRLLTTLGLPTAAANADMPGLTLSVAETEALQSAFHFSKILPLPGQGMLDVGAYVGLLSAQNQGPGVFITPHGAADFETHLGQWLVQLQLASNIGTLVIKENAVEVLGTGSAAAGSIRLLVSKPSAAGGALGNQAGTSLQLGTLQAGIGLAYTATERTIDVYANLAESILTIHPDEGDNFLNKVIPAEGLNVKFNALLGWSSAKGLYFGGRVGLKNTIPVTGMQVAKFLKITSLTTELLLTDKLAVRVSASGEVTLGPLTVSVGEIGLAMDVAAAPNGGNAGPFDINIAFKGPSGVGIAVESDLVTGGGYLFLDTAHHKYAGGAALKLKLGKSDVNLNALGLLQTELSGNPDAYSLLLLITATFTPIELGLGFTLNGLGGLLGINRAADTAYLRGLTYQGQLDKLLFPANVLDNPADVLSTVDQAFPATEGRYIIGLIGRLGWGVPTSLLTLDVALLVELPSPVRLLILGVLQASLPSKTNELLKLRADFLGSIDFGAKKVAFDAALSESKILVYSLTGDMAFRLYQGDNPVFLISAGGFHPSFQPPAGADLPTLRRLTLALAQGNDLRLTMASYFAVTSNTVQFGAHLDFYFNLRLGLHVEGNFGLDTLFQFSPFRLLAHLEAGVAIKRGGSELLGIHLALDVTGPGPWHIWGEASFRIWFVKISVDVNGYIGSTPPTKTVDAPDVRTPLLAALNNPSAWEVVAPAPALPGGVALRPAAGAAGHLFLDARGALALRQHVVPLGIQLEKYGNDPTAPTGGQRFDLLSLKVGSHTYAATDAGVTEEREFFAPDQFRRLSDAQRLSLPSFQLLPSGLRVNTLDGFAHSALATRRVVTYEQLLYQGAATGTASGGTLNSLAGGKPSARRLGQLARGGALGRAVQASQPSARAAQPISWAETAYAVVDAATLTPYADPTTHQAQDHFGSQVQAEQYCQAQPTAAELLVVPAYQLALA